MEKLTRYRIRIGIIPTEVPPTTYEDEFIQTTTPEAHICFQMIVLYESNFENGYINTLRMRSFYIMFCGQTMRVLHFKTCNVHKSHFWARQNSRDVLEYGYQVHFTARVWARIVGDHVLGPYLLPDRLTAQRHRDFL
jgi:hypothetical protein